MSASRRLEIVAAARGWLEIKYRKQGRTRHGGIDCIGLPIVVGQELGYAVLDKLDYGDEPKPAQILAGLTRNGCARVLPITKRQIGDILLLRDGQQVRHCGILSEKHGVEHVINANGGKHIRKVIEEPLIDDLLSRLVYVFRFPGIE